MKLFLKDQGTAKLHKKFAKFQISKQEGKENSQVKNKAKEFAKEIKAEIEAKESSGLMTKETK